MHSGKNEILDSGEPKRQVRFRMMTGIRVITRR